jgi:branched-chain amino acid transport system permease protein
VRRTAERLDAALPVRRSLADFERTRRVLSAVVPIFLVFFAVRVWPIEAPWGVVLDGAIGGGRIALIALGIALIYRANRVVNFAQGDLGSLPATLAVLLILSTGLNYFLSLAIGIVAALVLGIVVEMLIIRRFFRAPRLILTVATIGLAQLLTGAALFLPQAFGNDAFAQTRLEAPFTASFEVSGTVFSGSDIMAMILIPAAFVGLALWLRLSDAGTAVRASAERADRASTLGIPVRRLHTVVWTVATLLAFLAMWLRASSVGLPIGTVLGPTFLLQALAAVVIGRMDRFTVIAGAAICLGILDKAMTFQPGNNPAFNDALLFVVVLVALLVTRRPGRGRVDAEATSSWQAAREVRPIPRELAKLPEVRLVRYGLLLAVAAFLVTLPLWLDEGQKNLATVIVLFGIVGISLVVLTGWAGQVSLGQVAFVAVGAAVGGGVTDHFGWDLGIAMLLGGAAGALAAVIIGYPALRRRGLTLAVSTLAFALFVSSYLLNPEFFGDYLPAFRIERTELFGRFDLSSETNFYYLSLVALLVAILIVVGVRRSRTGRVLVGIRENESAARAFGVNVTRTSLAGFALSGFLAAFAGVLFVHQQSGLQVGFGSAYLPEQSLKVFSMVVIGGLGSIPGALLGSTYVRGVDYFLPPEWQFLATGGGLLLVLMIFPGGFGSILYQIRDFLLRDVAKRRKIVVPSLVADVRVEEEPNAVKAVEAAAAETIEKAIEEAPVSELAP